MQMISVNIERCIGCRQCEFACAVEHSTSHDPARAATERPVPHARVRVQPGPWLHSSLPERCRHCDPAPCLMVCPTGALARDDRYGLVLVTASRCIGCAMCAMVCPFDVVAFHPDRAGEPARLVATKCDGCVERRGRGEPPACVEACKVEALVFGEPGQTIGVGRPPVPDHVLAWRTWGEAATHVAEGVDHDNAPSA